MMTNQVLIFILFHLVGSCQIEDGSTSAPETVLKLVIDHDGGADDALAISMSLLYEKYFNGPNVVALTTTYGNINESQTTINSARILKLCERSDIPIYAGAQKALISDIESDHFFGFDGLGDDGYNVKSVAVKNVHAAVGLIKLSKKYKDINRITVPYSKMAFFAVSAEGDLVIMAIGPLTNIALAIKLDSNFIGRLSQLYIGAGHVQSEAYPDAEFNAAMDPEAYSIVATNASVEKVTILPYSQVFESLNISKEWRVNVLGAIDTPIMRALNGYERLSLAAPGSAWILLDPAVAAIVLNKDIVKEYKHSSNGIHLCGTQRGINTNCFTSKEPNTRIVYSATVEKYKKHLIDVYSAELLFKS